MNEITISVLLPAYNAERFIAGAIESVLSQSFPHFELLILDDGSTDSTREIAQKYRDRRVKLIECPHNFIATLNRGIELSRGKYIARIDADDLMHVDRLKMQYHLMEEAPELTLCSSWASCYNEKTGSSQVSRGLSGLVEDPDIAFLGMNVVMHPTVMIRRTFLAEHSLQYSEGYPGAEDYKLWVDMALRGAQFYIEPEPLILYRLHDEQISIQKRGEQVASSQRVQRELLQALLSREELQAYRAFVEAGLSLSEAGLLAEREFVLWMQSQLLQCRQKRKCHP